QSFPFYLATRSRRVDSISILQDSTMISASHALDSATCTEGCANTFIGQELFEISNCANQAVSKLRSRSPRKYFLSLRYIWPPLTRIIRWAGFMDNARACAGELHDQRCKLLDREFFRIADIDRSGDIFRRGHQAHEAIDQVIDVAEGAALQAIAVNCDVAPQQSLNDEI